MPPGRCVASQLRLKAPRPSAISRPGVVSRLPTGRFLYRIEVLSMSEKKHHQGEMPLIHRTARNKLINQRAVDGYINATAMCRAAGKLWNNYYQNASTKNFIIALCADTGIPVSELIQIVKGGKPEQQGTWAHPQVAIHLAQWLSPEFAVQVSKWVFDWLSGMASERARLPDHVRRYMVNQHKIPPSHFSMLNQMTFRLLAPLEGQGYILPAKMMPDISLGRMFSGWLREKGYDPDSFPSYRHEFLDYRPDVDARLYPNELMTEFNQQLEGWLKDGRARKYFGERDGDSIEALGKVLDSLPALPGKFRLKIPARRKKS